MTITMISSELCEMLNVTKECLRAIIKRKKLEERLLEKGYRLINKYKQGRDNIYELEIIEKDEWSDYQRARNIQKKDEHTIYVENRITNGLDKPRKSFIKELNIELSESTAGRYDKMLLEDEIIEEDREVYLLFNPKTSEFTEISEEAYKQFWKDSSECTYQIRHNYARYKRGDIPESTYESNKYLFMTQLGKEKGVVAIKFHTYKEYTNTRRTLELIAKHKKIKK